MALEGAVLTEQKTKIGERMSTKEQFYEKNVEKTEKYYADQSDFN